MLSDRKQLVLRALIEEYVAYALPVGSRRLVERYDLGFSSATIRSELSALEELGYLEQPHTSAGRVPTDNGYRTLVDDLLSHVDEHEVDDALKREMRERAGEVDELMSQTSQALTRLTACLAYVVPPRIAAVCIKQIDVVWLAPSRLLLVVITDEGRVFNRQIELESGQTSAIEDARALQELLNRSFSGRMMAVSGDSDVTESQRVAAMDERFGALYARMVDELIACVAGGSHARPNAFGVSNLLGQPEFSDSHRLRPVLEQLEDDMLLLQVFEDALVTDGPIVRIGHENSAAALSGMSLVASRYGDGEEQGLIAVVGPTRMNYSRVIEAVRAARDVLGEL